MNSSDLTAALHRYAEARNSALVAARLSLGMNELDARALLFIAAHAGARPSDLRSYLGITSAGVTTLIDRLVARQAVCRDVDAADRRVSRLIATADLASAPWSALTQFDEAFLVGSEAVFAVPQRVVGVESDHVERAHPLVTRVIGAGR